MNVDTSTPRVYLEKNFGITTRTGHPQIKHWTYGVGEEGIKIKNQYGNSNACVIDENFPWWLFGIKSIDLIVSKIWLMNTSELFLHLQKDWCGDIPVVFGQQQDSTVVRSIIDTEYMFIGGKIPDLLIKENMWNKRKLKFIVSTSGNRSSAPKEWVMKKVDISHSILGGITNGRFTVYIYHRRSYSVNNSTFEPPTRLGQDLRWVLKTNVYGVPTAPPKTSPPRESATRVNFVDKGVISSCSLYPFGMNHVTVVTQYLHNNWVRRPLTYKETLMMMDVPEHLVRRAIATDHEDKTFIPKIPGKVLEWVVVQLVVESQVRNEGVKRTLPFSSEGPQEKKARQTELEGRFGLPVTTKIGSTTGTIQQSFSPTKFNGIEEVNERVAKNDDAAVPTELWDHYFYKGLSSTSIKKLPDEVLNTLRGFILRCWRRNVVRSYFKWELGNSRPEEKKKNREAARDCFRRAYGATIWSWDLGSRPFFWRWPIDYIVIVRDGLLPYYTGSVPPWKRKQRRPSRPDLANKIKEKLQIIRDKEYVEKGKILSVMPFFDVPKGDDDVRMVYNGSASGLNNRLWAPWFPLPTVDSLKRALHPGYYQADNDVGEMFHNFIMHQDLREYCGLDMTLYFGKNEKDGSVTTVWERWNRLAMGLRNSPYTAVQGMLMAQEIILGNRRLVDTNVFHWEKVKLNLPGFEDYTPSLPWISKVRFNGQIAADLFIYVDDVRSTSPTQDEAWKASQRISSSLGWLGLQDAARKRRAPSLEAGAWTGSVVWTSNNQVCALTTLEKWNKAKSQLLWMKENINNKSGWNISTLKSIRGFLVYLARTYTAMVPYLKGLHATIDSWRPGRDADGWKHKKRKKESDGTRDVNPFAEIDHDLEYFDPEYSNEWTFDKEPKFVFPVPRFKDDLDCLMRLTESSTPPLRRVRMTSQAKVMYGFGDASKEGFGASIQLPNHNIVWRFGQWRLKDEQILHQGVEMNMIKERSSNYRELRNLVEAIEQVFKDGLLNHCELFMFTDNSTAEAAYFKGTSSSRDLFDLVLRLRAIEMTGLCMLHVVHVAGTRMIWQGTDGLSRGDRNAGVMAGESMLSFIPLHKSATERSSQIVPWIEKWYTPNTDQGRALWFLQPEDWFGNHEQKGVYVWSPAPSIGDVALEYLSRSIHKRPHSIHAFLCPRLMSSRWMRVLNKSMDICFTIPIGCPIWDFQQHEPLIFAFSFPLHRKSPWRFKLLDRCETQRKFLQEVFNTDFDRAGIELCKLISLAWSLA
jgi:hypothetical protein